MLNTDDLRYHTEVGTGYSKDAMLAKAADEIERLRAEVEVQAYWGPRCEQANAEIQRLRSAIRQTLDDNGHLADGENCTLIVLKRALKTPNAKVTGDSPAFTAKRPVD